MKKVELIKKWHEKIAENGINYSAARLEMLLESLCDTLSAELFEGGEVSLPGIGKLKPVQVPGIALTLVPVKRCSFPRTLRWFSGLPKSSANV